MKSTLILFLLAVAFGTESYGQSTADYEALQSFMSADDLANIQQNQLKYAQMAYLNRHGYHVSNIGEKSGAGLPDVSEIISVYPGVSPITLELAENQNLNLLAYTLEINISETTYFRFGDTGKVLAIPPVNLLLKKANLLNE